MDISRLKKIDKLVEKDISSVELKRKRQIMKVNLEGPMPKCLENSFYPSAEFGYAKNGQRWRAASIIWQLSRDFDIPVDSLIDVSRFEKAWDDFGSKSGFLDLQRALIPKYAKVYSCSCSNMKKAGGCPFESVDDCCISRGSQRPSFATPSTVWASKIIAEEDSGKKIKTD